MRIRSLPIFVKPFSKRQKRKFVSILKSPHVNKTAQEQFEYRIFSKHFLIFSIKPQIFLLFLKRLKSLSFSGLKLEIEAVFRNQTTNKSVLRFIDPDNILLQKNYFIEKKFKKDKGLANTDSKFVLNGISLSKEYIQSFDSCGEIYLRNIFYV